MCWIRKKKKKTESISSINSVSDLSHTLFICMAVYKSYMMCLHQERVSFPLKCISTIWHFSFLSSLLVIFLILYAFFQPLYQCCLKERICGLTAPELECTLLGKPKVFFFKPSCILNLKACHRKTRFGDIGLKYIFGFLLSHHFSYSLLRNIF